MDLCVLPQTGVAEQWLLVAVVAVVLIGAGIALAVSGRARRSVLTGLGALAIIGALVAGGIGGAAPAQADAGSTGCVTAPAPVGDGASAATLVAPGIPTAAAQCAAEPTVQIPSTQGVSYAQSRTGSTLTVTAAPTAGYAFVAGATTSWTFDMTATTAAPWPVELPERTLAYPGEGSPFVDGAYLVPQDADLVPALQAAAEAGALTYVLDGSQWRIQLDVVAYDAVDGTELGRVTASQPLPSELTYDWERGEYLLVSDVDEQDIEGALEAAVLSLSEQFPDAIIEVDVESEEDFLSVYRGLEIRATYEPGVGCDPVTAVVPLDLGFPEMPAPLLASDALVDSLVQGLDDALDVRPDAAPASEAPASETPAPEAPASQAPEAPSETDAASDSAEEVVEPTAPVTEP